MRAHSKTIQLNLFTMFQHGMQTFNASNQAPPILWAPAKIPFRNHLGWWFWSIGKYKPSYKRSWIMWYHVYFSCIAKSKSLITFNKLSKRLSSPSHLIPRCFFQPCQVQEARRLSSSCATLKGRLAESQREVFSATCRAEQAEVPKGSLFFGFGEGCWEQQSERWMIRSMSLVYWGKKWMSRMMGSTHLWKLRLLLR